MNHSYEIRYDQLMGGDALDRPGHHVVLFYKRFQGDILEIYEAKDYGAPPDDPKMNLVKKRRYPESDFTDNDYLAIRYNEITGDPPLIPGDCNGDGAVNVSDPVFLQNYLFVPGSPVPEPLCRGDVNDDGAINVSDIVYLLNYLFLPGSPPPLDGCD